MTKLIIKYLFIAFCILSILCFIILCIKQLDYKEPIPQDTEQIDSLNNIIKENNIILKKNNIIIDSLYNHKTQIITNYETTIENYSNPTIVSDDSISRYISEKLYNWR